MNEYDPDFFLWHLENKQNIINRYLATKPPSLNNTTQKKLNEWITSSNMKQVE